MSFEIGAVIIKKLNEYGYDAYFVGGAVRDSFLGRAIDDIDIATAAPPEKVIEIFPKTIPVGIEHGTVIVRMEHLSFEVTTFRREGNYQDFRHPSSVDFISSITEDLKRRDFTINAMAQTIDGEIIDPFDGQADLTRKLIKTVGSPDERFQEDPLRIMRGIRFISMLGFSLDESTRDSIINNKAFLTNIAIERLTVEFEKMLLGESLTKAIQELVHTEVYRYLPGLVNRDGLINFGNNKIPTSCTIEERWGLLCYFCHDDYPLSFLKKWKLPNQKIKKIINYTILLNGENLKDINAWFVYKEGLETTLAFRRLKAVLNQTGVSDHEIKEIYEGLSIKSRHEMNIDGNDLIKWCDRHPGPWIEQILAEIEKLIVNRQLFNEKAAIKEWVMWRSQSEVD